ncbi:hypothetical protein [Microbacterium sp.]|uniref:hypothetical protein n=1 Tax=Microbacterium sp. TaxID=51671 RepID=UPI003A8CA9D9
MNLPSELELGVGAQFRAPITGAGSQGYRWLATVTGDAAAVDVRTVGVVPADEAEAHGSYARELQIDALAVGIAHVDLALTHAGGRVRERHLVVVHVVAGG